MPYKSRRRRREGYRAPAIKWLAFTAFVAGSLVFVIWYAVKLHGDPYNSDGPVIEEPAKDAQRQ